MGKTPLGVVSKMVIHALKSMKRAGGCSLSAIRHYITTNYKASNRAVLKKISLAVMRGVTFGAIKKSRGFYKLDPMMAVAATQAKQRRHHAKGKIVKAKARPRRKSKPKTRR